ncbi:helix-turn-helix transcriptional regulator [Streptomyces torulosus]|uniref:helix-turn-helix transcriptional regulator n=1 Tax=Streptomyces torulosus TaxID=68276 RepID=UPI003B82DB1E
MLPSKRGALAAAVRARRTAGPVAPSGVRAVRRGGPGAPAGELTADPISDDPDTTPSLLVMVRVLGEVVEATERPAAPPASPTEARVLALLAGGATTARPARETGLTVDGVNHHLRRLSARWSATGRTELVARAYALGVLAPGVWPPAPASTTKSIGPSPEV